MNLRALFNSAEEDPHTSAMDDPSSLGNILLRKEYITADELQEAIEVQKSQVRLGEILQEVTGGRLTNEQVEEALMEQKIDRKQASNKEMRVFHHKKKQRLVKTINDGFDAITAKLEEVG